jgi:CRP-like cAMP-binding protein
MSRADSGALGRVYEDGEYVIRQGELGDCMYVIQEGRVSILIDQNGEEVPIATRGPGDLIGEMAIFEREVRSAHVRALGRARILTVDKANFLRRIHEDPSLGFRVAQTLSRRLRELGAELAQLKHRE